MAKWEIVRSNDGTPRMVEVWGLALQLVEDDDHILLTIGIQTDYDDNDEADLATAVDLLEVLSGEPRWDG